MLDVGATDGAIGMALAPVAANGPSTAEARIAKISFRIETSTINSWCGEAGMNRD